MLSVLNTDVSGYVDAYFILSVSMKRRHTLHANYINGETTQSLHPRPQLLPETIKLSECNSG
jgi:hypothetical protein